jgi:sugar O-acyltransferase (sialic acid O-acetyltransferase NeuD family)
VKLVIVGAGQTGRLVGEFLRRQPALTCVGYVDDDPSLLGKTLYGHVVLGGVDALPRLRAEGVDAALVVLGNMAARMRLFRRVEDLGFTVASIVDPSVNACSDLVLGRGAVVSLGTNILTNVRIGPYAQIGTGITIGHDVTIGINCVIGGNTVIGASTEIGDHFVAGTGVVISAGPKRIGHNVLLCAGAVVFKDVPDHAVVIGNPGRVVRYQEPLVPERP